MDLGVIIWFSGPVLRALNVAWQQTCIGNRYLSQRLSSLSGIGLAFFSTVILKSQDFSLLERVEPPTIALLIAQALC
jgi:hypothetical protein